MTAPCTSRHAELEVRLRFETVIADLSICHRAVGRAEVMKRQKSQSLRTGNLRPQAERRVQERGLSDADDLSRTDITTRKQAEEALEAALHGLERHVEERTAELQRSNVRLAQEIEERKRAEADIAEQLRFETLLADLSARFVNVPADEVDREIMDAQRRLCEFLGLDMSALWQWSDEAPGFFTLTHFYSAQEGPQPPRKLKQEDFPWIAQQMLRRSYRGRFFAGRSAGGGRPRPGNLPANSASSRVCASRSRWAASRPLASWALIPRGRNATGRTRW